MSDENDPSSPPSPEALAGWRMLGSRGAAIAQYLVDKHAQRIQRATSMLEIASLEVRVDVEELVERIGRDERLSDLMEVALKAAAESGLEAKRRALGKALASGALAADDARVDESELMIRALAHIEAPHVRLMNELEDRLTDRSEPIRKSLRSLGGQTQVNQALLLQLSGWGLVTLDRTKVAKQIVGDALDEAVLHHPRRSSYELDEEWKLTNLGLDLLAMLQDDPS